MAGSRPWERVLAIVFLLATGVSTFAADAKTPELSPTQKKSLQTAISAFKRERSAERRLELIVRVGEISPSGVEPLLDQLNKELQKELAGYRQQLTKAAAGALAERVNDAALQEITGLRMQIQTLAKREDLSKEMIKEVSDPALLRLKQLILIDRAEVFRRDRKLDAQRLALAILGKQWEAAARIYAMASDNKEDASEPTAIPTFEDYLLKEEEHAIALAVPMDPATRAVLAANAELAPKLDPEEARCMLDLNLTRNLVGLPPLAIDPLLVLCARDHAGDMQKHKFFSHESPVPMKKSFGDRAKLFKTSAGGENIAAGTSDGLGANAMWWHSPGHHKNMLGDYKRVGVGRAGKLWTEMLGG